ncbi:MAG: C2H2-type zinc finger protein [Dehalococcoidia bacterium]|nr:C2H2-type zinc finger protein [Dehalococcoidia bacterium]
MSKTISWPARVTYIFIALALALSLVLVAIPAKTDADPGLTKWSKVTTPTDSNETIIQGADIYDIAIGPDGDVIYAIGKMPVGRASPLDTTTIALWKSTDGGATWSDKTSKLLKANVKPSATALHAEFDYLTQVAVAPNNADFVVVAGMSVATAKPMVVGSTDGATKFYTTYAEATLTTFPDIICMDISRGIEDVYNVALGTDDGKVWRYEAGTYWGGTWVDASAYTGWQPSTKVTSVAFSPSWSADKTLLAISTNSTVNKTWLQTAKWGTTKGWGSDLDRASKVEFLVATDSIEPISTALNIFGLPTAYHGVTGIALPSDYHGRESSLRRVYAYVDVKSAQNVTAGGYLFRIDSTTLSIPCGPTGNPWFGSLAYHGDHDTGDAMLGMLGDDAPAAPDFTDCCVGVQVWRTDEIDICCPDWKGATKKPSGQAYALVAFTPDGDKAYAITAGEGKGTYPSDESAFSVSLDNGKCWNQLGLIDTDIDFISDMAASPDCSVTYLATMNTDEGSDSEDQICNCDSVWMKDANATEYAGVWQRIYHKALGGHGLLRLSPEHDDGDVVYWGAMGTSALYWAESKGICKWSTKDAPTISIEDFALADDDTLYVINNSDDLVKWTEAKGDWFSAVDHKAYTGHTIAVLGDYVLVGGSTGSVGYSDDAGSSFSRLGDKGELGLADGHVHVALDTYFTDNNTVYAAISGGDQGIWRWVVDDSTSWSDLHAEPSNAQLGGTGTTTNELDYYGIVTELSQDGNPKTKAANGGVLYAVYSGVTAITDAPCSGVARCLTPAQETCCGQLSWDYLFCKLSVDTEEFSRDPSALKICGCLTADSNSNLFAIDNRAYYAAYTFSAGAKFTTSAQGRLWTYEDCFAKAGITLEAVADGVTVASDPCICANEKFVLEWERLCNACEYDLQISLDDDFTQIVFDNTNLLADGRYTAGPGGFYDPPKNETPTVVIWEDAIDCNTTYYWRVRSRYAETPETIRSFWSDVWSFTVEAGPTVAIDLTAPDDGATKVALTAIGFTWSAVADATNYDFVLSANADLSSPVETKTGVTGTAYTYTGTLDYDTTYFWQVTAMKDGNVFSESNISTFTTAPAAVFACPQCGLTFPSEAALKAHVDEVHAPVEPTTPAWVWIVIGLGAVLVITIIVLIFRTRRV